MALIDLLQTHSRTNVYDCILIDPRPADVLVELLNKKTVLLVVDRVSPELFFTNLPSSSKLTLLNLSSGLSSFSRKGRWETRDVAQALTWGYTVQEAYHVDHLLELVTHAHGMTYIRANEVLPEALSVDHPEAFSTQQALVDLQSWGFSGIHGTILTFGGFLHEVLISYHLQQEKDCAMNVFVASSYQFPFSDSFINSLKGTEKLILVFDQAPDSLYVSWIKARIWESNLSHIQIKIITPEYDKITAIMPEYSFEQAGVDAHAICAKC